jgi:hypothetical protein
MKLVSVPQAAPSVDERGNGIKATAIGDALRLSCKLGRASLLVLAAMLPFEVTQRPLLRLHGSTVSNLELTFYAVAALAVITVALAALGERVAAVSVRRSLPALFGVRGAPLAILWALVAVSLVSSLAGTQHQIGIKWTLHLAAAAVIWMAAPLWLAADARFPELLAAALVAGAAISALLGLAEVAVIRPPVSQASTFLSAFKPQPTVMGSYVRLSGTFEYANIAAGYFAMVMPFALVALIQETSRRPRASLVKATLWTAALLLLLFATLLTYSRGGVLAAGAGMLAAAILMAGGRLRSVIRRRRTWILGGTLLLGGAGGFLAFGISGPVALRLRTQSDLDWYRATFEMPAGNPTLPSMATGHPERIPIAVTNTGALTWRAQGQDPYRISYHWLLPSGRVAIFDGYRTDLPADLSPGATVWVAAKVVPPVKPGRYLLVWDVVQENVVWFSIHSGTYTPVPVRVVRGSISGAVSPVHASYPHPDVLPQASPEPGRLDLWAAAWRMIQARPLLGVGPDGYRLTYGRYATPRLTSWDTRIYANSLPLEVAADLGLVGAALFLGFLVINLWPLVLVAWGTSSCSVAVAGALVAVCVHGLVDYLLADHAIFILCWLLLACAAAAATTSKARAVRAAGVP